MDDVRIYKSANGAFLIEDAKTGGQEHVSSNGRASTQEKEAFPHLLASLSNIDMIPSFKVCLADLGPVPQSARS